MKVAIMTFQFADNYGAMLQACALKKYLSDKGAEVSFIDYTPENEKRFYSLNPFSAKDLKGIIKKALQYKERVNIHKRFLEFQKSELGVPSGIEYNPEKLEKDFDIVIVGSDQVWNPKIVGDTAPYLFKGISSECIKASYAASMSIIDKESFSSDTIRSALSEFNYVSVREDGARKLLNSYGLSVKTVVDPVFLPDVSYWNRFEKKPKSINANEQYAIMYLLRDDENCVNSAEKYAKKHKIKLYYVHPLNRRLKSEQANLIADADPHEFVWLINHADAVFTNSFHATSFSIIFEKKLQYIHKKELGERVADLLSVSSLTQSEDGCVIASCNNSPAFTARKKVSVDFIDNIFNSLKGDVK